ESPRNAFVFPISAQYPESLTFLLCFFFFFFWHFPVEDRFDREKKNASQLKRQAEAAAPITDSLKKLFSGVLFSFFNSISFILVLIFRQFPSTIEELEAEIQNEKARADLIYYDANPQTIKDYEQRKAQIDKLRCDVEEDQRDHSKKVHRLEELKV